MASDGLAGRGDCTLPGLVLGLGWLSGAREAGTETEGDTVRDSAAASGNCRQETRQMKYKNLRSAFFSNVLALRRDSTHDSMYWSSRPVNGGRNGARLPPGGGIISAAM